MRLLSRLAEKAFEMHFQAEATAWARGLKGTGHLERNKECTRKHIQSKAKLAAAAKAATEERLKSSKRVEQASEFVREVVCLEDSSRSATCAFAPSHPACLAKTTFVLPAAVLLLQTLWCHNCQES
jgi:hypothetical protein